MFWKDRVEKSGAAKSDWMLTPKSADFTPLLLSVQYNFRDQRVKPGKLISWMDSVNCCICEINPLRCGISGGCCGVRGAMTHCLTFQLLWEWEGTWGTPILSLLSRRQVCHASLNHPNRIYCILYTLHDVVFSFIIKPWEVRGIVGKSDFASVNQFFETQLS